MIRTHGEYEIDDSRERIDFAMVHAWLSAAYWSQGETRDMIERAAHGSSLLVGAYAGGEQVGYLRVVSDRVTFAWLSDVYVADAHRRRGLARAMVGFAVEHSEFQGMRRWLLATRDAHGVYAPLGFAGLTKPQSMMEFRPNGVPPAPAPGTPGER